MGAAGLPQRRAFLSDAQSWPPTLRVGPRSGPAGAAKPGVDQSRATLAQRCAIYQGPTSTSRVLPG